MEFISELRLQNKYPVNLRFERATNFFEEKLYGGGRVLITYSNGEEKCIYDDIDAICSFARSAEFLLDCIKFHNSIRPNYEIIYEGDFKKDIRDIILDSYIYAFQNSPSGYEKEVHFINRMQHHDFKRNLAKYLTEKCSYRKIAELKFRLQSRYPQFKDTIEIRFSYPYNEPDFTENIVVNEYSLYDWFKLMIGYYASIYNGNLLNWLIKTDLNINNYLEKNLYVIAPKLT